MKAITAIAVVLSIATPSHAQHPFSLPVAIEPGPIRLEADFDQDGDRDLLTTDAMGVTVMLNSGDGRFFPGPFTATPPGSLPQQVIQSADFDGDGAPDIVIRTVAGFAGGPGVLVLRNSGAGNFTPFAHIPLPPLVLDVNVGDANGDGFADIAVHWFVPGVPGSTTKLAWFLSNGAGGFTEAPAATFPDAGTPDSFVLFDANGDGLTDVAIVRNTNPIQISLAITGTGAALTAPAAPSITLPLNYTTSSSSGLAAPGDVDGDGDQDLVFVVASASPSRAVLTAFNLGSGNWSLVAQPGFVTGSSGQVGHPMLGDWNGDGHTDLLTFGGAGVVGQLNDGSGQFAFHDPLAGLPYPGTGAASPFLADLDGDGRADLVGDTVIIFSDGDFIPLANTLLPATSRAADLDDDGDPDFNLGFTTAVNDGRGGFTLTPMTPPTYPVPNYIYQATGLRADFDGDGIPDLLANLMQVPATPPAIPTFDSLRLLRRQGNDTLIDMGLAAAGPAPIPQLDTFTPMFDVDGDGDIDLAPAGGIWVNDGHGFFTPSSTATFAGWKPTAAGDIDGNGDVDLLAKATDPATPILAILRNDGGTFTPFVIDIAPGSATLVAAQPQLIDLDDDGDLDTAWGCQGPGVTPQVRIIENLGGSAGVLHVISGVAATDFAIAAGDIDGDGRKDLVVSSFPSSSARAAIHYRLPGSLGYRPPVTYIGAFAQSIVDVDGDGDMDLGVVPNHRLEGPDAGFTHQFGLGSPGAGGFRPQLSGLGPFRTGNVASLRVRQAAGGSPALLVIGLFGTDIPDFPFPGMTAYVHPAIAFATFVANGVTGQPTVGGADLPFVLPPWAAQQSFFAQIACVDGAAPSGLALTNGVEIHVGL